MATSSCLVFQLHKQSHEKRLSEILRNVTGGILNLFTY